MTFAGHYSSLSQHLSEAVLLALDLERKSILDHEETLHDWDESVLFSNCVLGQPNGLSDLVRVELILEVFLSSPGHHAEQLAGEEHDGALIGQVTVDLHRLRRLPEDLHLVLVEDSSSVYHIMISNHVDRYCEVNTGEIKRRSHIHKDKDMLTPLSLDYLVDDGTSHFA